MLEKRKHPRYPYQIKMTIEEIYLQEEEKKLPQPVEIEIQDISHNGIGFRSSYELPLDHYFKVSLLFEHEKKYRCVLQVNRKNKIDQQFDYGAVFVGLAENLAMEIEKYLSETDEG